MDEDRQEPMLIDRLARCVPRIEPNPFFAARVARLAMDQGTRSLTGTIAWLARRLVPLMSGASLVILAFALWTTPQDPSAEVSATTLDEFVLSGLEGGTYTLEDLIADREATREVNDDSSD